MRESSPSIRQPPTGAVHASPTAPWRGGALRQFAIATAAGLFMAFVGAFNTGPSPLSLRLGYWLVLLWTGAALGAAGSWALRRIGSFEARPLLTSVVLALALAVPMTLVAWLMTGWAFHLGLNLHSLAWFFGPVLLVCLAMTTLNALADRQPAETHAAASGQAPVRFLERLPFALRGAEIHAIQAEDHYLRLHTSRGSDLILMRLSDAVAELEGIEGAQTHRSWWVARDALVDARSADGRATLILKSGVQAPVSRTYVKALRTAGWW